MTSKNTAASVRARLLQKAKMDGVEFQRLLTKFTLERLLYRLSISSEKDHFLLKGALLFDLWYDVPFRPTRDIDLLGFGLAEIPHVVAVFEELCNFDLDDGVEFDAQSINVEEIRKEANYAGLRITLMGLIDSAKCLTQVDIGYGDAVTPAPEIAIYPVIFEEFPAPELLVYPKYTVVAEKLEAIVTLGMINSRMKDYFDLWIILGQGQLETSILSNAITATFNRRGTRIPDAMPTGLSDVFALNPQKIIQWHAFTNRNALNANSLIETVTSIRNQLAFLLKAE